MVHLVVANITIHHPEIDDHPKENRVIPVEDNTFETIVLKASSLTPILVFFGASWCGPCKKIKPEFDKLSNKHRDINFVYADLEHNAKNNETYKISGFPTLILFHNQKMHEVLDKVNKDTLITLVQKIYTSADFHPIVSKKLSNSDPHPQHTKEQEFITALPLMIAALQAITKQQDLITSKKFSASRASKSRLEQGGYKFEATKDKIAFMNSQEKINVALSTKDFAALIKRHHPSLSILDILDAFPQTAEDHMKQSEQNEERKELVGFFEKRDFKKLSQSARKCMAKYDLDLREVWLYKYKCMMLANQLGSILHLSQ